MTGTDIFMRRVFGRQPAGTADERMRIIAGLRGARLRPERNLYLRHGHSCDDPPSDGTTVAIVPFAIFVA